MDPTSARRLGLIVAIVGVLLAGWGYRLFDGRRMASYLAETDAIQREHSDAVEKLNGVVAQFSGEPTSAAAAADALRSQAGEFDRIRARLAEVEVPSRATEYQRALERTYTGYSSWSTELAKVADYIDMRSTVLEALSQAVGRFDQEVTAAKSNADVVAATGRLRDSCTAALDTLRALERPSLLTYADAALQKHIADLGDATGQLGAAVKSRDRSAVTRAAASVKAVLARDWALAVQETDLVGSERYAAAQRDLTAAETAATAARSELTGSR